MMSIDSQKEQFSKAYVAAVAAVAGFTTHRPEPDIDSVDLGISDVGGLGSFKSPKIDLQLKCTSQNIIDDVAVSFPLKIKNYNELRFTNYQVPRILVVVIVPDNIENWLTHSETELAMKHCGYWFSLYEAPETNNTSTVTITIPRAQLFTVDSLKSIMNRVRDGGLP